MTEKANTAPVIVPGSPEHDAAMIALAETQNVRIRISNGTSGESSEVQGVAPVAKPEDKSGQVEGATSTEESALILGKFKSQEDLIAAYTALEQKQSGKPAVAAPGTKPTVTPEVKTEVKPAVTPEKTQAQTDAEALLAKATNDAEKQVAQTALDAANAVAKAAAEAAPQVTLESAMKKASDDYAAKGELTEDAYTQLAAAGISKEYADAYVDGMKARAEVVTMKVFSEAGGQDQYAVMANWVAANWSQEQIEAHNAAVHSGDLNATLGAIRTMKGAYAAAQGTDATTRIEPKGGAGNTTPTEMYKSSAEMQADMNNPLYAKGDRAFHAAVDRKLEASIKAGINLGF